MYCLINSKNAPGLDYKQAKFLKISGSWLFTLYNLSQVQEKMESSPVH